MLVGLRGSGNFLLRSEPIRNGKDHALQALFPLPRAGTSSEVPQPGTSSSSFSRPSGGQDKRGGSQGAPGVVSWEAFSPPARHRSSERRGGGGWSLSLQPLRELGRGRLLGRDGLLLPMPLPRLLLPTHHSTLRDMISREKFRRTAPLLDPPVFPDLRIEEQGRIAELALDRTALVTVAVVLALAPLAVRGRERRGRSSSRSLSSHERSRSSDCSRSRGGWSRSSDRYRSRCDRSRSSDRYRSRRQRARSPARRRARGHAIFLVVLVTARGLVDDHLPPLTIRGQRREDGKPE